MNILFNWENKLDKHAKELIHNKGVEDIADCCRWIMKIIIRSGLALTIERRTLFQRLISCL